MRARLTATVSASSAKALGSRAEPGTTAASGSNPTTTFAPGDAAQRSSNSGFAAASPDAATTDRSRGRTARVCRVPGFHTGFAEQHQCRF